MAHPEITFKVKSFDDIKKDAWNTVFQRSRTKNLFYGHTTLKAAIATWSRCQPNGVIAGYHKDALVFLQPFRINKNVLGTTLEVLQVPTADGIEPLIDYYDKEMAFHDSLDFIKSTIKPDLLIAKSLNQECFDFLEHQSAVASLKIVRTAEGALLELPESMEEFWVGFKSKSRYKLKKKIKKGREAGLTFRFLDADHLPENYSLAEAFDNLTNLHDLRIKSKRKESFFTKPDFQKFHRQICESSDKLSYKISFTEALHEGKVVGSIYGFSTQDFYIFMMIGFDPAFLNLNLGTLLIYHTVEDLIRQKVKAFDFKVGDEAYKREWTKDSYIKYDLFVLYNLKGRVLSWEQYVLKYLAKLNKIPVKVKRLLAT